MMTIEDFIVSSIDKTLQSESILENRFCTNKQILPDAQIMKSQYNVSIKSLGQYTYKMHFKNRKYVQFSLIQIHKTKPNDYGYEASPYTAQTMLTEIDNNIIIQHRDSRCIPNNPAYILNICDFSCDMYPYKLDKEELIENVHNNNRLIMRVKQRHIMNIYAVIHRSQLFELVAILHSECADNNLNFATMKKLKSGIYPFNEINIDNYFININGISVPICEEIEDNKIVFYKHNFDRYRNIIEKELLKKNGKQDKVLKDS